MVLVNKILEIKAFYLQARIAGPCFTLVLVLFNCIISSATEIEATEDAQIKAAGLYNLTKFVNWDSWVLIPENQHFLIGLVGVEELGSYLVNTVKGEKVRGKPIFIENYATLESANWESVDLLFVGQKFASRISEFKDLALEHNILTVADSSGFCEDGGMINLLSSGKRLKIEVNVDESRRGGLRISAQVLKLATLIKTDQGVEK